ncbi:hypothetical protein M514_26803 [Trichuris suis]|uniref:Uncharacterized protein n=1 Tax=Trichuris suis TaxID=68888 RepID=A0A085MUV0_9BILA|nr:hypothetical protein M514_26803 [Trichuris suis]
MVLLCTLLQPGDLGTSKRYTLTRRQTNSSVSSLAFYISQRACIPYSNARCATLLPPSGESGPGSAQNTQRNRGACPGAARFVAAAQGFCRVLVCLPRVDLCGAVDR